MPPEVFQQVAKSLAERSTRIPDPNSSVHVAVSRVQSSQNNRFGGWLVRGKVMTGCQGTKGDVVAALLNMRGKGVPLPALELTDWLVHPIRPPCDPTGCAILRGNHKKPHRWG